MARIKIHRSFGAVPNELLNNPDITFKAKGMFAYLNSKPEDWDFSVESIARQNKEGLDAIRTALHELEQYGYLVRQKYQNEKGFWEIDYILYDTPSGNSYEGKSYLGKSDEGKSTKQYKKEYTKKENIKKEEIHNDLHEKIQAIVSRINEHAGTSFRAETRESNKLISARLKNYSLDEALRVVDAMAAKWLKTDMKQYYTPVTLFREANFEKYLQHANTTGAPNRGEHVNSMDYKWGKMRYRPQSEFGSYTQYIKNCNEYGHTAKSEGED